MIISALIMLFTLISVTLSVTRNNTMKIIDLILFNGEPMAMHRFFYLKDVVDYFIVIESNITLSGKIKSFYYLDYYYNLLKPLIISKKMIPHKITIPNSVYTETHITLDKAVKPTKFDRNYNKSSWKRERYLRNLGRDVSLGMMGSTPFILLVNDADELPKRSIVRSLAGRYASLHVPLHLEMSLFYYSFLWRKREVWSKPYAVNDIFLKSSENTLEGGRRYGKTVPEAGWHCSYCMNASDIVAKIRSFAHTELDTPEIADEIWTARCRREGLDLFHREQKQFQLTKYDGKQGYPFCRRCIDLPGYSVLELPTKK